MASAALPPTLSATERAALADFTGFLRSRFGPRIRVLQLFGSRARGEGHEESDLDVLAVIEDLSKTERNAVWEYTGDVLTKHDVVLGGLTMSRDAWRDMHARELRIVEEIARDGVDL